MWLRNADQNGKESQLAWSSDYGNSWTYSDWKFTSGFGCPTFLNFRKDYRGAKDNYVYVYSHDEIDAYKPADQMILARVAKNKISDRNSYEFFAGLDKLGKPVWSENIDNRAGVFSNPAMCY